MLFFPSRFFSCFDKQMNITSNLLKKLCFFFSFLGLKNVLSLIGDGLHTLSVLWFFPFFLFILYEASHLLSSYFIKRITIKLSL